MEISVGNAVQMYVHRNTNKKKVRKEQKDNQEEAEGGKRLQIDNI